MMNTGQESVKDTLEMYEKNLNNNYSFIKSFFDSGLLYIPRDATENIPTRSINVVRSGDAAISNHPINSTCGLTKIDNRAFTRLRDYIKTLDEVYEGRWNIEAYFHPGTKTLTLLGFTINFPTVAMTNREEEKHLTKDFYAHIPFYSNNSSGKILLGRLLATRVSQTDFERQIDYIHSHMREGNLLYFTRPLYDSDRLEFLKNYSANFVNMCLGDSSVGVQRAMRDFNNLEDSKFSPTNAESSQESEKRFIAYLLNIRAMLRYESLEGGPYKRFTTLLQMYNPDLRVNSIRRYYAHNISEMAIERMSNLLLRNALRMNPNLSFRFDVQAGALVSKKVFFHDSLKLEQILFDSFKDIVARTSNPSDRVVIVDESTGNRQEINIKDLVSLFYTTRSTRDTTPIYLNPDKFYISDRAERTNTYAETSRIIEERPACMMFQGRAIKPKRYNHYPEADSYYGRSSSTRFVITRENTKIDPKVKEIVEKRLTQKITKNVFKK